MDASTRTSITIAKKVGCGYVYCVFVRNKDNTFHKLFIYSDMAKSTECGSRWLFASSKLLTYALRRAIKDGNVNEALTKHYKNNLCNKYHMGVHKSCAHAIARSIEQ